MSKAPNPNIQETTLDLSVFYDATKTNPDEIAKRFNNLLHAQLSENRDALVAAIGDTRVNNLHCPVEQGISPLQISDGEYTEGVYAGKPGAAEEAEARMLRLVERGSDFSHEVVVCNRHGQAWYHVYIDYFNDKLQFFVHRAAENDEEPLSVVVVDDVFVKSGIVVKDTDGSPMPVMPEAE